MKFVMFGTHYINAVGVIKARMETMRTSYVKAKKTPASGSEAKKLTSRQTWLLRHLTFLDPFVKKRTTDSNMVSNCN